jgi:hypothetical protein
VASKFDISSPIFRELYGLVTRKVPEEAIPKFGGTKWEQDRLRETIATHLDAQPDVPQISIFDLEGEPFVMYPYDRAASGSTIVNINGVDLKVPVDLLGGQGYMFDNPGQIGSSGQSQVSSILAKAAEMKKKYGKDPIFLPRRMGTAGVDFSHMPAEAMVSFLQSALGRGDRKSADKIIKQSIPDFKGLGSKKGLQQIRDASGDQRKVLMQDLHKTLGKEGAGLTTGEARFLVTDPRQSTASVGGLQAIGRFNLGKDGGMAGSSHPSYPISFLGEGEGELVERNLPGFALLPEEAKKYGVTDIMNPDPKGLYATRFATSGVIDDKKLRNIEEMIAKGLITLGPVGAAYAGEGEDESYNPFASLVRKYGFTEAQKMINDVKAQMERKQQIKNDAAKMASWERESHRAPRSDTLIDIGNFIKADEGNIGLLDALGTSLEKIGQGMELGASDYIFPALEVAALPAMKPSISSLRSAATKGQPFRHYVDDAVYYDRYGKRMGGKGVSGAELLGSAADYGLNTAFGAATLEEILRKMAEQ